MLSEVFLLLIILTKQGVKYVLTQIMPFIEPHRPERHHSINILSYSVIIVVEESNRKHFKGYKLGIHDVLQNNHVQLFDNSTYSC